MAQKILFTSRTKIFSCFWQKNKRIPCMLRKKGIKVRQRVAFRGEWNAKQAAEGAASCRHVLQARHTLSNFHNRAMKFDARPSVLAYDKFRQLLENRAVNYGLLERILLTFTRVPRLRVLILPAFSKYYNGETTTKSTCFQQTRSLAMLRVW